MTQTLRRELRKKFEKVIRDYPRMINGVPNEVVDLVCENLADAALEVSGIAKQEKKAEILQSGGLDWSAAFGAGEPMEVERRAQKEREAVNAFERAFGGISWAEWWSGRKEWDKLREFIAGKFAADPECFKRYVAEWLPTSYGKGMTALQIKRRPQDFPTAWASFEMDNQPTKKTDEARPIYGRISA